MVTENTARQLDELKPHNEFFIGVDSDGCAFDTMEIKHKECFCPQYIGHFGLQAVSKYARETWEFVNLYSKTRGLNRFLALIRSLDMLRNREEVAARGIEVPALRAVREWAERETRLGNPALEAEVRKNPDKDLNCALAWTTEVNDDIRKLVHGIPPFPGVRKSLKMMQARCDTIVVSQTPCEALNREWAEHDIDQFVRMIAGQEMGSKAEHIALAAKGKYPAEKIMMIGDAPGDLKAAKANEALFYPIVPGAEEASWKRLHEEALENFFAGKYAGEYEKMLIDEFNACLPEKAPWEK
ncbi:MAG: HAD hydrolase-like protein [Chitinivibrionales bacterium]|nr:HAD hydrolase-like protein [Chitinivibrionales bacterium]MBD3357837.1 HAD hydrolase-like protein [Chitinivibrionales bacterium]